MKLKYKKDNLPFLYLLVMARNMALLMHTKQWIRQISDYQYNYFNAQLY